MRNPPQTSSPTRRHAYKTVVSEARTSLPFRAERQFSKIIHISTTEALSELLERTVARPAGLLGASLTSSIGLITLYMFSVRGGFKVQGSEVILLLVGGYTLGLLIELPARLLRRK